MDWSNFKHDGESPSAAFEALAGQLFERFCRQEYRDDLSEIRFVSGKGGDGGVEAYAILKSGSIVGLQAKWFREGFGKDQVDQIAESFSTAIAVRKNITRYIVATPRNLADDRTPKTNAAGKKPGRPEKTQRERWNDFVKKAGCDAPHVTIELWDDAKLETLLTDPANEGLRAYWFSGSIFTLSDLQRRFGAAKARWLHDRYVPDLHATSAIERDLALRLGEPEARAMLHREVADTTHLIEVARDATARLERHPAFMTGVSDAARLRKRALDALDAELRAAVMLEQALSCGRLLREAMPVEFNDLSHIWNLRTALGNDYRRDGYSREVRSALDECLEGTYPALLHIREIWLRWAKMTTTSVAYTGNPGVGKTYALAHAVASRLKSGLPALLLRAKECKVRDGLAEIFRRAIDVPTMSLREILNAMEATATRADVRRARDPNAPALPQCIERESSCFLLAIDGLEESGQHVRWAELLGELGEHLQHHPRIRLAISLRSSAKEEILGRNLFLHYDEVPLPVDGDVQAMFPRYCQHYGIPLPARRVRWAIRDPLSLRLFCESIRDGAAMTSARDAALARLLRAKLARVQEKICDACGISKAETPLHKLLVLVTQKYVESGAVRRDELIELAEAATNRRIPAAQWSKVLAHAVAEGLLLEWPQEEQVESLLDDPIQLVEAAYDALVDYLLAETAKNKVQKAQPSGGAAKVLRRLAHRPDAVTQAALLLADAGIDLRKPDLWPAEFDANRLDLLILRAIASMEAADAEKYDDWVRERLVKNMPSCRRVLAELCIPVSRDETHPLGPLFVHETLLSFASAKRDSFWSGPRSYPGDGEPWAGRGVEALERLKLEADDVADGPPLLLGWALTSVDAPWRARVRVELARWGAGRLDQLIRWLDLIMQTNDPQMAEDAAMVAFGAACLAGTDPKLSALAEWVAINLLAPEAKHRREDIVVLHAARGIVERAHVMGIPIRPELLDYARAFYSTKGDLLPIDAQSARDADEREGISPVVGDLAWYVVRDAIEPFFGSVESGKIADPAGRAERLLALHAEHLGYDSLSPKKLAFGFVMAHLHEMGWSREGDFRCCEGRATHGARSTVCGLAEKYTWTARYALQGRLAGWLPAKSKHHTSELLEPPVDPVHIMRPIANPASEALKIEPTSRDTVTFWPDDTLTPRLELHAMAQLERANEWVRRAPAPDLRQWLLAPPEFAPNVVENEEWITLSCEVLAREPDSQAESFLRVGALVASPKGAKALRSYSWFHPIGWSAPAGRYLIRDLCERGESVLCNVYVDPSESVWAPWATGICGVERIEADDAPKGAPRVELQATNAGLTWESVGREKSFGLPAFWLRQALGLVDARAKEGDSGIEWQFLDRKGEVKAVYTRGYWDHDHSEALLVRRSALEAALESLGKKLVWAIWLFRQPSTSLVDDDNRHAPWARRHFEWFAFLNRSGVDIVLAAGSGGVEGEDAPAPRT